MTNNTATVSQTEEMQTPPGVKIMNLVGATILSQALYVTAKLDIAELLRNGPQTSEYLAVATSSNEDALYRVLRALSSEGIFMEVSKRVFSNTEASETLLSDHPASTRDLTIWMCHPDHWNVYSKLEISVKTGKTIWEEVHGEPIFPYLFQTNTELGDIFNRAMTSYSQQTIPAILAAYDFSEADSIADIAGGYGHLLGAILQHYPDKEGVLFDLPEVLKGAPAMLESYGVADRSEIVAGNFTTDIPVVADVYLLKHIIHDWDDDICRQILGNIRKNMPENAKILIIDSVIPEENDPDFGKILDLEMLIAPGGKERTEEEFRSLLASAGFEMTRVIQTQSAVSVIEAIKA